MAKGEIDHDEQSFIAPFVPIFSNLFNNYIFSYRFSIFVYVKMFSQSSAFVCCFYSNSVLGGRRYRLIIPRIENPQAAKSVCPG